MAMVQFSECCCTGTTATQGPPGPAGPPGSSPLTGVGSPEGVVTADPGSMYFEPATNALWVKNNGTGNTGWVQLLGP